MSIFDREDIYMDNYYEYPGFQDRNRQSSRNVTSGHSTDVYLVHSWTGISRFLLTILLRIGFLLVQIGSVPVTNVNLIILHNIVDFSCVTLAYVLAGFVIAYSGDLNGLMGEGHWIGHASTDKEEVIIGWQAIVITSAICTSCLVGRTHTVGYLFIGIIMAGVLQPFMIHWAWTPKGWMAHNILHDRPVAFRDYGGSSIVHLVGSVTGLIGCIILGRRILRLRDIDDASLPADSAGNAFAGYSLILLGLQSLCLPSTSDNHPRLAGKHMSLAVVNNLLGASACSLLVVGLHFFLSREPFNHWTVTRCMQASVAGAVIVSAGVDVYSPIMCIGLGCTGGIVFYLVSRCVFESALEDYCNIAATHLTCALVGSFVAPFCRTSTTGLYDAHTMILNVAWQIICLVTIVTLVVVTVTVAFVLLECLGLLRNRSEFINHLRAAVALERGPSRSFMERLFYPDGETLCLQPGTAPVQRIGSIVGPRFAKYQRAIAKLQMSKPVDIVQATNKTVNPKINAAATDPSVVLEPRVKKFRHIHTIRPTSHAGILEFAGKVEAMGDKRTSLNDEKKTGKDIKEGLKVPKMKSISECSGDSSANRIAADDFFMERLTELNRVNNRIALEKNLNRRREPYRLHGTQKCMNLCLKAIRKNENSVKFLVEPRPRSFVSSQSTSEEESEVISETLVHWYQSPSFDHLPSPSTLVYEQEK